MDNDTYDDRIPRMNDQINIRFIKLENEFADYKRETDILINAISDNLTELQYNIDTKIERIDDILVVQRNQTDNQRKNFHELRKVLDDKVMDLLEKGEHGKE